MISAVVGSFLSAQTTPHQFAARPRGRCPPATGDDGEQVGNIDLPGKGEVAGETMGIAVVNPHRQTKERISPEALPIAMG